MQMNLNVTLPHGHTRHDETELPQSFAASLAQMASVAR
jgi:hypothetical protein